MKKIKEFLIKTFSDCYGLDALGKALLALYLILFVLLNIALIAGNNVFVWTVRICYIAVIIIFFYRMLSKNHIARQRENNKYLIKKRAVTQWFGLQRDRIRDRKTHIYKKCPECRAVLRLKRIPGKHRAVCPKCGKSFDVTVKK